MPPVVPAVLESSAAPRGGAAAKFTSTYGALSREVLSLIHI